jgi:hypothetical protein
LLIECVPCESNAVVDKKFWEAATPNIQKEILKLSLTEPKSIEESGVKGESDAPLKFDESQEELFRSIMKESPKKIQNEPATELKLVEKFDDSEPERVKKVEEDRVEQSSEIQESEVIPKEEEKVSEAQEEKKPEETGLQSELQEGKEVTNESKVYDIEEQVLKSKIKENSCEGYKAKENLSATILCALLVIEVLVFFAVTYATS